VGVVSPAGGGGNPPPHRSGCLAWPAMEEIPIRGDMIRLGQLLKLSGIAQDGAHAKEILAEAIVQVNGEHENRRGRQIHPGDEINIDGQKLTVVRDDG
jgi:ribosome-associated protein